MLCTSLDKKELSQFAKKATDWVSEYKMDGVRMRLFVKNGKVQLANRSGDDVTALYPELHNISLKEHSEIFVDGEAVCMKGGISSFSMVSHRTHLLPNDKDKIRSYMREYPVTYVVFDLLELDGLNVRGKEWIERRKILETIQFNNDSIVLSEYSSDIMKMWEDITSKGGEGIILKHIHTPYYEGKRVSSWKKVKANQCSDIYFTKYTIHNRGIRCETEDGNVAITVNGEQAKAVQERLDNKGKVLLEVKYLERTEAGAYRMPTFVKMVEESYSQQKKLQKVGIRLANMEKRGL